MRSNLHGFSLMELMIVIAIIGILTVIGIPSYQNYTKKARFTEVISATMPFKIAISLALQQGENLNELTNGTFGIPDALPATKNLASLKVEKGIITAIGTKLVDNATYILKPTLDGGSWKVEGTCLKQDLCRT